MGRLADTNGAYVWIQSSISQRQPRTKTRSTQSIPRDRMHNHGMVTYSVVTSYRSQMAWSRVTGHGSRVTDSMVTGSG
eukprot:2746231-Rhodomonas_salina.2